MIAAKAGARRRATTTVLSWTSRTRSRQPTSCARSSTLWIAVISRLTVPPPSRWSVDSKVRSWPWKRFAPGEVEPLTSQLVNRYRELHDRGDQPQALDAPFSVLAAPAPMAPAAPAVPSSLLRIMSDSHDASDAFTSAWRVTKALPNFSTRGGRHGLGRQRHSRLTADVRLLYSSLI